MNIKVGEFVVSNRDGRCYRVVEYRDNTVSLKRVDGYTLFSCHPEFIASWFHPARSPSSPLS